MQRRDFILASTVVGAGLWAGNSGASALRGRPTEAEADEAAARLFEKQRRYAETRFGRIAYVEQGNGDVALFLHGFPLNGFQWRGALERLSPHKRCIAPDFMGLGFTEVAPGQGVAPADQVAMLGAFLDRLKVGQVDLIANDSGGAVAQLFVIRYPERVRTMLLTNCDVEFDSPPPALLPVIELAREGTYPDKWLVPWVADKKLARSPDGLGGMCYSDPSRPTDAAIDMYLKPLIASPESKALANAYTIGLTPNPLAGIEPELRRCKAPTRIVWGTSDTIFSAASPGYLDRLLPNSKGVRPVPKGKLFFPEEYPDLIAEEALRLWRST